MKSYKDKKLLFSLLALGLFAGVSGRIFENTVFNAGSAANPNGASVISAVQPTPFEKIPAQSPVITLGFAGDISLSHKVASSVGKNMGGDYSQLFTNADFLKNPDITFAHLNGVVSSNLSKGGKDSFAMNPSVAPALRDAGVDIVSIADTHLFAEGDQAFSDTLTNLHSNNILTCGADMNKGLAEEPTILSRNGTTVGFLCFSDIGTEAYAPTATSAGILLASDPDFDQVIKNAADKVNTLIISFNFGVDAGTLPTARQVELAKAAINDGAAFIVGTHPHASQMISDYNGASIVYSVGDLISDYIYPNGDPVGTFVTATLSGKTISNVSAHSLVFSRYYAPSLSQ